LPKTLAEIAIEAGLVSKADAARAGRLVDQRELPLIAILVREIGVDEVALVAAIRRQTRVPLVDPADALPDPEAIRLMPRDACKRLRVLPLAVAADEAGRRVLRVAMADPTDEAAIAEVEHLAGCEIEITALPLSAVEELVDSGYKGFTTAVVRAPRRRFGDTRSSTGTSPHIRTVEETTAAGAPPVAEPGTPLTVPFHVLSEETDVELRFRALYRLLLSKALITEDEFEESVRELVRLESGGNSED
jgi:hypothetical protein